MLPCSVCESRGNFHLVLFESDEQGGDQYASQDMLVQNQLILGRAGHKGFPDTK